MNNYLPSVLASYNVPIPTPPQTVLGDEVIRDKASIRIPGAQTYLAPPQTNLDNALMRIPGAQRYITPLRTISQSSIIASSSK